MSIKFPPEFLQFWRDPTSKAAWVSNYDGPDLTGCDNCKGSGFFATTIALAGPFDSSPSKGVIHWADGKWWSVINKTADCPICKNVRSTRKDPIAMPIDISPLLKSWEPESA